jgi:phosphatase NudJ
MNGTGHWVIVCAVVERDGKYLLLQENHQPDKGTWNLPAGKLEIGEEPLEAVIREVKEESGLAFHAESFLGIHSVWRTKEPAGHVIRVCFAGTVTGDVTYEFGEVVNGDPEIAAHQWLTADEVKNLDDSVLRYIDTKLFISQHADCVRYPLSAVGHFTQAR